LPEDAWTGERAAERGVGTFVAEPVGVVAGGDEELAGGVVADAVHRITAHIAGYGASSTVPEAAVMCD
jgi:hypothetical protein